VDAFLLLYTLVQSAGKWRPQAVVKYNNIVHF